MTHTHDKTKKEPNEKKKSDANRCPYIKKKKKRKRKRKKKDKKKIEKLDIDCKQESNAAISSNNPLPVTTLTKQVNSIHLPAGGKVGNARPRQGSR